MRLAGYGNFTRTATKQDLRQFASRYSLALLNPNATLWHTRYLNNLGCKACRYFNIESAVESQFGNYEYINTNHPTWLLKDATATAVTKVGAATEHPLDYENAACRSWVQGFVKDVTDTTGTAFLDLVGGLFYTTDYSGAPCHTGTTNAFTETEWQAMHTTQLSGLRNLVGNSVTLFANPYGYGSGLQYYTDGGSNAPTIPSFVNHVLVEGAFRWATTSLSSYRAETRAENTSNFQDDVNLLITLGDKAVAYFYIASTVTGGYTASQVDSWLNFVLASAMLGLSDRAYFLYRDSYQSANMKDYYPQIRTTFASIGKASESFTDIADAKNRVTITAGTGSIYDRAFGSGHVYSNPTSNSATFTLGVNMYDVNGALYPAGATVVGAHTGLILLTSAP